MAKVVVVGDLDRKSRYCPQCRKLIPEERILENGIKCVRCGFIRWEEFDKYPSFIDIPSPDAQDLVTAEEVLNKKPVPESNIDKLNKAKPEDIKIGPVKLNAVSSEEVMDAVEKATKQRAKTRKPIVKPGD